MKTLRTLALIMLMLVSPALVYSQQAGTGTPITQTAARVDAAIQVSTSASSAATITLTPNAGQSVYIGTISIDNCAGSSAVTAAAVTTLTTTNLNGSPAWTIGSGVAAGLCQPRISEVYPTGLKAAAPGTAVTFVLPAFATNQTLRVNVSWWSAP